jgi:outer membrane protein
MSLVRYLLIGSIGLMGGSVPGFPQEGRTVPVPSFAGTQVAGSAINLTMAETLKRVEAENLNVLLGKEFVQQAIEAANRERSGLLPKVDIDIRQTRAIVRLQQFGIGGGSTGGEILSLEPINNFSAKIIGSFKVIDPKARAVYEAARRGISVSEYEYDLAVQEVLSAAARTYYTHMRNKARMTLVDSNIERALVLLGLARTQVEAGVATQIDLTRSMAQLATEQQDRLQQETVVVESGLVLKQILNIDPRAEIDLVSFRLDETASSIPAAGSAEEAYATRKEHKRATEQLEQNKLKKRALRWQRFPTVDIFGEYGYGSSEAFDSDSEEAWLIGVSLNVPIFDGFQIESNKRLADSRIRAQEHVIRELENQIESELVFAVQDARSRLAQISVAEENRNLADEELHLARIRFEQGVADNREVIDAQNSVARQNDNLVQAIYLYNLARLDLARVRGEVRMILSER